ncbi:hypothetical protein PsYK624_154870 [Phanerochaete sordida]|uniref:Uncharacterized protein n=1 Tax=Phanerochaete sordida TaxID=48140 RepID=A0A9P3LMD2_9APHY|nr:hypothetical protein PsYK624_154870 [Phanerochaete sordida]
MGMREAVAKSATIPTRLAARRGVTRAVLRGGERAGSAVRDTARLGTRAGAVVRRHTNGRSQAGSRARGERG